MTPAPLVLSYLDRFTTTPSDRVVVSAGILLGLLVVVWAVHRARDRATDHVADGPANAAAALAALVAMFGAGTGLIRVWEASPGVRQALASLEHRGWLFGARTVLTAVLILAAYVATSLVRRAVHDLAERREGISRHQIEITFRTAQVVLYAFAFVVALTVWGVNLGGLLVGAGFLGIVIGMAARQTIGAMLAGFVLMFSRPFEIGDWVRIGENEGRVTDITVVNTRLQTVDGEYVMLPNDLVASQEVVNRSRKGRLRISVEVGVDYATDLDRAMAVARDALGDVDEILSVPQPKVVATSFGDSAVVLSLRVWIDKPSARRKWRAQSAVVREVKAAFDREGVKIPFPQRELTGRAETGGFEVTGTSAVAAEDLAQDDDDD